MKRELCRYCRKPMANEQDCDHFQPGEGEHLCWHILQNCDQDAEEGIDLRDKEIARLERELEQERQLADRLAGWAQQLRDCYMGQVPHDDCACGDCQILPVLDKDLAAWKAARNEAVNPPNHKAP